MVARRAWRCALRIRLTDLETATYGPPVKPDPDMEVPLRKAALGVVAAMIISVALVGSGTPAHSGPGDGSPGAAGPCPEGSSEQQPAGVRRDSRGGEFHDYVIEGWANTVVIPPLNFDPVKASDADLDLYAYPARPDVNSPEYPSWVEVVSGDKRSRAVRPCTALEGVYGSEIQHGYSGYQTNTNPVGTFDEVYGRYRQPITYDRSEEECPRQSLLIWTGLHGGNAQLLQNGTAVFGSGAPYAWYEYLGPSGSIAVTPLGNFAVRPGDLIYSSTRYVRSTASVIFYVNNQTTGQSASLTLGNMSTYWDGTFTSWTAEPAFYSDFGFSAVKQHNNFSWDIARAGQNSNTYWSAFNVPGGAIKNEIKNSVSGKLLAEPSLFENPERWTHHWYACYR